MGEDVMHMANEQIRPALLALDWGTSSLRAYLLDGEGRVLQRRSTPQGIQALPAPGVAGFEQVFAEIAGDWLKAWPHLPVAAGGMVGSAQGWKEAPYVRCPADVGTLAARSVRVGSGLGPDVVIAPGVLLDDPAAPPDVIRGEEIQIAGALAREPDRGVRASFVLPGSHSKWVQVEKARIIRFSTYMTGELFAVLLKHSILGRLMTEAAVPDPNAAEAVFAEGLDAAGKSGPGDWLNQLFWTRTLGLTRRLPQHLLKDFLSGLLIGHELASGLAGASSVLKSGAPLILIGDEALCKRYAAAFARMGVAVSAILDNTAPAGLWEFARAAGLPATAAPIPS
jgi:2-dehydro-3-deoxygalactonokinase